MLIGYEVLTCCHSECGISFAVPGAWERARRADHSWFNCPNGHQQHFSGQTAEEKLRRERDRAVQEQARLADEAREAMARADKAEAAQRRLKKRAAAGTCPCCKRTFGNMSQHMLHQHPGWVKDNTKVVPIRKRA